MIQAEDFHLGAEARRPVACRCSGQGHGDAADEERPVARTRAAAFGGSPARHRCSQKGRRVLLVDDLWELGRTERRVAEGLAQY
jgi:hypothetical protein